MRVRMATLAGRIETQERPLEVFARTYQPLGFGNVTGGVANSAILASVATGQDETGLLVVELVATLGPADQCEGAALMLDVALRALSVRGAGM